MNREHVAKLLTYAAAADQRTVGEADLAVWYDILAPIDFDAAFTAMRQHYRRQPDVRLKPGHLWQMCATRTDGDRIPDGLDQTCDHGTYCRDCKLVHRPEEPCAVLEARPWPRALTNVTRAIPAGRDDDEAHAEPEVDEVSARAMEAERARQLAALEAIADTREDQPA